MFFLFYHLTMLLIIIPIVVHILLLIIDGSDLSNRLICIVVLQEQSV